jgi:hypothetical protein
MTEQDLRTLVRDAIARHMGSSGTSHPPSPLHGYGEASLRTLASSHGAFALFVLPSGADQEGPCLIEPTVMCNHCGYCKSYGH